jgi:hypothetical protein
VTAVGALVPGGGPALGVVYEPPDAIVVPELVSRYPHRMYVVPAAWVPLFGSSYENGPDVPDGNVWEPNGAPWEAALLNVLGHPVPWSTSLNAETLPEELGLTDPDELTVVGMPSEVGLPGVSVRLSARAAPAVAHMLRARTAGRRRRSRQPAGRGKDMDIEAPLEVTRDTENRGV